MTLSLPTIALPERREAQDLLQILAKPPLAAEIPLPRWDRLLRAARASGLAATIGERLDDNGVMSEIPTVVRQHLSGATVIAKHRSRLGMTMVRSLGPFLAGRFQGPVVLLKGLAYLVQNLRMSAGRMFDDVDIMVPRAGLDAVEQALVWDGWITDNPDPYDQRYYREWSHELPPMRHPRYAMQLDVHHTIIPVTSRARPNTDRLFTEAVSTVLAPWKVLSPPDQVLHACAHLFLDSDCVSKVRDLADIDGLCREFSPTPSFWFSLVERANTHGLGRYLWYGATFCRSWLDTPIPEEVEREIARFGPVAPLRQLSLAAMRHTLPPPDLDLLAENQKTLSHGLLSTRAALLRMPIPLLAYHAANKFIRSRLKVSGAP